jgi:serine/threonine protein kinase
MVLTTIRNSYDRIENLVDKLSDSIPESLKFDLFGLSQDKRSFAKRVEAIREVFELHKPSIIIGEHIGTGGFANVFKATANYNGVTDFAIKILRSDLLRIRKGSDFDPNEEEMRIKDMKKRFTNESYVQWDLSKSVKDSVSESVVKVYDHGEYDSRHGFRFILMERMAATLRDFISNPAHNGSGYELLKFKTLLMIRIAEVIRNIHSEGIFHRDIKPENILFPKESILAEYRPGVLDTDVLLNHAQVKLGDFGTVRWIRSYTAQFDAVIIGSQYYISPEQIFSPELLDFKTDVYSFGVVCYELLYGVHPKEVKANTRNFLVKIARMEPLPQTAPPGFERLHEIVFRCMDPIDKRIQSMAEVVDLLQAFFKTL